MAARATSADFAVHGLPATALDGFAGDVDDYLTTAAGVVDSYLRGRYLLPLSSPYPPEVVECECVLAAYTLISVRGFDPEDSSDVNIKLRYDDKVKWLREIARGRASLDLATDAQADPTSAGGPIVSSRTRTSSDPFRGLGGAGSDDDFWGRCC